jgi:hypothetical protein
MNEKFKIEVEKFIQLQKSSVKDKYLYKLIEKLVNEDPQMNKWTEGDGQEEHMESDKN